MEEMKKKLKIYQKIALVAGLVLVIGTIILFLQGNWLLGFAFTIGGLMEMYAYIKISKCLKSWEEQLEKD